LDHVFGTRNSLNEHAKSAHGQYLSGRSGCYVPLAGVRGQTWHERARVDQAAHVPPSTPLPWGVGRSGRVFLLQRGFCRSRHSPTQSAPGPPCGCACRCRQPIWCRHHPSRDRQCPLFEWNLPFCGLSHCCLSHRGGVGARTLGAATPATAGPPPSPPVRDPGPSEVRPASSANLGGPDDLGEFPLIHLDLEEAAPKAGAGAAYSAPVDLEPQQPRCQAAVPSSGFDQSHDAGVGAALPTPLCPQQLRPPRPWLPRPIPLQRVQTARPTEVEVQPRGAEASEDSETDAPNLLSWAEQVEQADARRGLSEEQGPATAPPCPAPLPRPWLEPQPQDILNAAGSHWLAGHEAIDHVVQSLQAQFNTALTGESCGVPCSGCICSAATSRGTFGYGSWRGRVRALPPTRFCRHCWSC